jgi:5-methylcytosine-specific restriction endonuclease McrA
MTLSFKARAEVKARKAEAEARRAEDMALRNAAKARGHTRFVGRPCTHHGQGVERRTCDGQCSACMRTAYARWTAAHPGYDAAKQRGYRAADPEKIRERERFRRRAQGVQPRVKTTYPGMPCKTGCGRVARKNGRECTTCLNRRLYAADPQHFRDKSKRLRQLHPDRYRDYDRGKRARHLPEILARNAKRRALQLLQRCICCTAAQFEEFFLQTALYSGHVDHIIPLALGGHHCTKNLQAMTDVDHIEKTKQDNRAITEAKRRSQLLRRWRAV